MYDLRLLSKPFVLFKRSSGNRRSALLEVIFSKSLIIHEAKTKENHKRDGFGNMIKHLHKLAKLSPSFSPEVRICLRSCIKHSH